MRSGEDICGETPLSPRSAYRRVAALLGFGAPLVFLGFGAPAFLGLFLGFGAPAFLDFGAHFGAPTVCPRRLSTQFGVVTCCSES